MVVIVLKVFSGSAVAMEGRLVMVVVLAVVWSSLFSPDMVMLWSNMGGVVPIIASSHNNAEGRGGAAKVWLC